MRYLVPGDKEFCSWEQAASTSYTIPEHPREGERRHYEVEAWIEYEAGRGVLVSNVWLSEIPDFVRKTYLKDLGLPVKKDLVYKDGSGRSEKVLDVKITDVWDGCCTMLVKLANGREVSVNSWYLSEMNSGKAGNGSMPSDIVVFDIETTGLDCQRDEICEIAAVKIEDWEVVDEFETLVGICSEMPEGAARVNNISSEMLDGAPSPRDALMTFSRFIGKDSVLVGHNVEAFDIPFLKRVAEDWGVDFDYAAVIDTLTLSRRAWPHLKSYSMDTLRRKLGLGGEGGHRALKDCHDEFAVYTAIADDVASGAASIDPPKPKQPRKRGGSGRPAWSPKWKRKKARDFTTDVEEFDTSHPLYGKDVVISGDVEGHDYNECMQAVCDLGGHPKDNITNKTDYLVVGSGHGGSKIAEAQKRQKDGRKIEIINERDFRRMLGWEVD